MYEGWSGDWTKVRAWIEDLYPRGVLTEADVEAVSYPAAIEIHAGSRFNLSRTDHRVDCDDYETHDVVRLAIREVNELLEGLGAERTQITVRLVALVRDEEGEEVEWTAKGSISVGFTRSEPLRSAPLSPASDAPVSSFPTFQMGMGGMFPEESAEPNSGGLRVNTEAARMGLSLNEQVLMQMVSVLIQEHRFLIGKLDEQAHEVISVHRDSIRTHRDELGKARSDSVALQKRIQDLQDKRMAAQADAQAIQLQAQIDRLEDRLNEKDSTINGLVARLDEERRVAEQQVAQATKQARRAAKDEGGPLEDKVGKTIEKTLDKVLYGMMASEETPPAPPQPQPQPQPQPRPPQVQYGVPPVGPPRPPRPVAPPPPAAPPAAGFDMSSFDPSQIKPAQAAFLLKLLPDDVRTAAFKQTVSMDREFALELADELADLVVESDRANGVDVDDD